MEEQLQYLPHLGTSECNVWDGRPWSNSTFEHCFALLLRIHYTHHRLKPGCNQLALGSYLLGLIWEKLALQVSWGVTMLLQWHRETTLAFQKQQLHLDFMPRKVTTFKYRLCRKSLPDKTPIDCKHWFNIANDRAASQSGLICRVGCIIWACVEYTLMQKNHLRAKPIAWLECSTICFGRCSLEKGSKGENQLKESSLMAPKQRVHHRHSVVDAYPCRRVLRGR